MIRARREGWEAEFYAAIEAAASGRFQYGHHDCCLWVASLIAICTGRDPAIHYRGQYASETGAARFLSDAGSLRDLVTQELGTQPVRVAQGTRGDPVMMSVGGRQCLGVIEGGSAVFLTEKGLRRVNLNLCECAWETTCHP